MTTRNPRVLSETADRTVAIDPTGSWIAFGMDGGGIDVVNLSDGELISQLRTESGPAATTITFAREQPILFVGDAYGRLSVWDTDSWQAHDSPDQGHRGEVSAIHVDSGAGRVYTAGRDGSVRLWSASAVDAVGVPLAGHAGAIRALAYDSTSQTMFTARGDGRLIARKLDHELWVVKGCRLFDVFGAASPKRRFRGSTWSQAVRALLPIVRQATSTPTDRRDTRTVDYLTTRPEGSCRSSVPTLGGGRFMRACPTPAADSAPRPGG